jgi:hypothetical protein
MNTIINNFMPEINLSNIKNSILPSQKTRCISITNTSCSMLFREVIAVYSDNTESINTPLGKSAEYLYF